MSSLNPADGPFSATEVSPPSGWTLTNIVCTGGANITIGSNSGFDPGDTGVVITLSPGENIHCTFTNTAPCLTPGGLNINTGTTGIGVIDPIWSVSSAPAPAPVPDAYGVPGDYGPWVHPSSAGSNWIDPNNTGGPPPGTFPPADPGNGTYVFNTSFSVPAGAQSFTATFNFAADNDVKLYMNNVLIPGTSVNAAFSALHGPITVTQLFPSGTYTLTAKVFNATGPTGLLVEGSVHCVPHLKWGDINCSGVVDTRDTIDGLKYVAGLTVDQAFGCPAINSTVMFAEDESVIWGDDDCDGHVDAGDVLRKLKQGEQLIFPCIVEK